MAFDWERISADFKQKYEGTYIRVSLKEGEPYEVFRVDKVVQGKPPHFRLTNEKWGEIVVNYDTEIDINFDFPEVGYFFHKEMYACLFTRQFLRQWKRGMNQSTVQFTMPYNEFFSTCPTKPHEGLITDAFLPRSVMRLEQANMMLNQGEALSVPLSNSFALGLHTGVSNRKLIWFLEMPIGEYDAEKHTVHLQAAQVEQEIQDYLNQMGDNCAIVR